MTTTRYGQHPQQPHTSTTATTTVVTHSFHHIPRTTWIVQAIPSSSISTNSRTRKRRRSRKSQNSSSNQGTKHDNKNNNEDDGSILSTSKYKTHFKYILIVILLSFTFADMVYAGTCWAKRTQSGKCKHPIERNISREECCGGGEDVGFTEKEMSEFEYFFATALSDGTVCSSCIESCKTAQCGTHKKCIMRGGQPKCVCAPKCKSKKSRPKRINRYSRVDNGLHHTSHRSSGSKTFNNNSNQNGKRHQHQHQHQQNYRSPYQRAQSAHSHQMNADVDVFNNFHRSNHPTQFQSDKIISIIAASAVSSPNRSSYPNISHSHKKSANGGGKPSQVASKRHLLATVHHSHSLKRHGGNNTTTNPIDNNVVNINLRRQISSVEQEFTFSKFHGHDIPYPPIDLALYDSTNFHQAVCGTDGKTYKSECQLKRRACRQESTSLSVAYKGHCQTSCKHVHCPIGQHCLEDQNLMPHCVKCSITCPPYDPAVKSVSPNPARLVCGVDGNTYRNLCEIKRTACMLGRSIPVAYRGACKENANCDTVRCKDRQVCLSDLVTHRPRCVSCSFKCPRRKRPQGQQSAFIKICGMNNKSYHSWCHMMRDACSTGYYIDIKHNGICQNSTKT